MPPRHGILSSRQDPTGGPAPPPRRWPAMGGMRTTPAVIATAPQPGHATARIDRTEFGITAARGLAARYLSLTVEVQCTRN